MIYDDNEIETASRDLLDREHVARSLVEMLNTPGVETPLTFGILGGWGTGKSSLMYMMKEKIKHIAPEKRPSTMKDVFVWFDTWAYARQEQSLWRALLLQVVAQLKGAKGLGTEDPEQADIDVWNKRLGELETSLYRAQTITTTGDLKVNWGNALPMAADLALRYATMGAADGFFARLRNGFKDLKGEDAKDVLELFEREAEQRYVAEVKALEQFRDTFKGLLKDADIGKGRRRLVVFVDDLDRCLPEDALAAIEAIKLFLYEDGCVFVLGMDPAVVERGVGVRYEKIMDKETNEIFGLTFDPADYLDKVIQIPFRIPPLAPRQIEKLLDKLADQDDDRIISDTRDLLVASVPPNPRTLKRVLNVLLLFHKLQPDLRHDKTKRILLAKLVLMQVLFREAYQLLYEKGPNVLFELESRGGDVSQAIKDKVDDLRKKMPGLTAMMDTSPHFSKLEPQGLEELINMAAQTTTTTGP